MHISGINDIIYNHRKSGDDITKMKIHMMKELRLILIGAVVLILLLTSSYFIYLLNTPLIDTKEVTSFKTNSESKLEYQVKLVSNPIYNKEVLESDHTYISAFTDSIDIIFNYKFIGDKPSEIQGEYLITMSMEGYIGKDKDFKSLWIKEYPVISNKKFKVNSKEHEVTEPFSINLSEYLKFVKYLEDELKLSGRKRIVINCSTDVEARVDKGTIKETYTNLMIIPLTKDFYEIEGQLDDRKEVPIKTEEQIIIPMKSNKIIFFVVVICLLILLLIYCVFLITPYTIPANEKIMNMIFKRHGSRMIELDIEIKLLIVDKTVIYLYSFEGLVRISDELVKPIMYTHKELKKDINEFYVIQDDIIYCYDFNHVSFTDEEQNNLLEHKNK